MDLHSLLAQASHLIQANPFISGGASVALFAFAARWLQNLPARLYSRVTNWLLMSVRVEHGDMLFIYLTQYLEEKSTFYKHSIGQVNHESRIVLTSNDGSSKWLWFEKTLVHISKRRPKNGAGSGPEGAPGGGAIHELISLSQPDHYNLTCFSIDRTVLRRFLEHVVDTQASPGVEIVNMYSSFGSSWNFVGGLELRPMESVVTKGGLQYELVEDAQRFIDARKRYSDLGIPWHRGYLLYGPPGNGKTSIMHAVASHLERSICVLDLSTVKDDADLPVLMSQASGLVFIEDIDCLFVQRDNQRDIKVSFSGLLNALDGIMSSRGVIVLMTTNHVELLDPALIRAGRVDRKFYVGNACKEQIRNLFLKFFPEASELQAQLFASKFPNEIFSMASIQGYLMKYDGDLVAAVANVDEVLNEGWIGEVDVEKCVGL